MRGGTLEPTNIGARALSTAPALAAVMMDPPADIALEARGRPPARPAGNVRSLAPREHGAYGQLGLPLVAALAMGRPSVAAVCLTAAAVTAFFAHEPVLVVTGQRGKRALREDGARARKRLLVLGAATAITGVGGLLMAPSAARLAAAAPLALGVVLAPLVARGEEKTASGELLAAATCAAAAIPVAIAAGVTSTLAWSAWAAWCLAFGASTLAVRGVIAHARAAIAWPRRLTAPVAFCALAGALAAAGLVHPVAIIGAAPMLALAVGLAARPPSPRSLKRVGWMLVASSVALAVALGVGSHL